MLCKSYRISPFSFIMCVFLLSELFEDWKSSKKIMNCKDARKIKALGRKVKNFHEDVWKSNCLYIVKDGNKMKVFCCVA